MSRTKFRYQKPYSRIYRVGEVVGTQPETAYQTIQAAINAAIADGHTAASNSAWIEIYDKGSAYVEDLALAPGVHLKAIVDRDQKITVSGQHTYNPGNATQADNTLVISGLNLSGTGGAAPTL